ncbi:hypothetical protein [Halopiger djelfimassiliensis]|uniref:hypothetical protein n=1 Tax=Halopiger djelfimassiliensis TaxID=1293047 RepID=UPI0012B52592|nr:hypothetical protein [Halopiger djelfimassiliensis]
MVGVTIELHFESTAAERRFVDSFLADAWSRFESSDYWETGWFWAYGQVAGDKIGLDGVSFGSFSRATSTS